MLFEIAWSLAESELASALTEREPMGFRVKAIAKYGPVASPRHAVLFHQTYGPLQHVRPRLHRAELPEAVLPANNALRYPALVSSTDDGGSPVYAVVFESLGVAHIANSLRPVFLLPQPWPQLQAQLGGAAMGLELRSLDVAGARIVVDDGPDPGNAPDELNHYLTSAAILWPQALEGPWVRWSAVLEERVRAEPDAWKWSLKMATYRSQADIQIAAGARAIRVGGDTPRREPLFLVWKDVRYEPWPATDPFDVDILAFGHDVKVDTVPLADAPALVATKGQHKLLVSVAIHGLAGEETATLVWTPSSRFAPLPRLHHQSGSGDGRHRVSRVTPPRVTALLSSSVTWADGAMRAVEDLYAATALSGGVVHVTPRWPGSEAATHRNLAGQLSLATEGDLDVSSAAEHPTPTQFAPTVSVRRFDIIMRDMMRRGARSAFLVVLRRGELKFARAYTYAEDGYPVATLRSRFRLASFTKAVTATLLLREFQTILGLRGATLAAELGVNPTFDALREATLEQALRHATGMVSSHAGGLSWPHVLDLANETADLPEEDRPDRLLEVGTIHRWYGDFDVEAHVPFQPGEVHQYNNFVFSCLGEVLGRRLRGDPRRWSETFAEALVEAGAPFLTSVLTGRSRATSKQRDEVPYHGAPAAVRNRWRRAPSAEGPAEDPLPYVSAAYDVDYDAVGGGGGMALSALELARFLAALTPRPNRFAWNSYTAGMSLAATDGTLQGGGSQGLGWIVAKSVPWSTRSQGVVTDHLRTILHHNGGAPGTSSFVIHLRPTVYNASPATQVDTVSIGVVFNSDVPIDFDADMRGALLAEAQRIELGEGWEPGDLLDEEDP